MCPCILAVAFRRGTGVNLQVLGFWPLLGPAGIDEVTLIVPMVIA